MYTVRLRIAIRLKAVPIVLGGLSDKQMALRFTVCGAKRFFGCVQHECLQKPTGLLYRGEYRYHN